jgi:signal transduction histidine kinase
MDPATVEILLVEDDPDDARLTVEILSRVPLAHRISVAQDGASALAFLRREGPYAAAPRPDLVLLDLGLPGKSGQEVLEEIKRDQVLKTIPIAVLSASSQDEDIIRAYNLHAENYLLKPSGGEGYAKMGRSLEEICRKALGRRADPERMRVLLVEDGVEDARFVSDLLCRKGGGGPVVELVSAGSLAGALEFLGDSQFDAVLLDLTLPDSIGLETIAAVHKAAPQPPLIVLTAIDDEATAVQSVQAGAQDYLVKGQINGSSLLRSLRYAVERRRIERLKEEFSALVSHELRNPLTVVMAVLALAVDWPLEKEHKALLSNARRNAVQLNAILDNLMRIAGISSGRGMPAKEDADIAALAREVLLDLRPKAQAKGLELKEAFPPGKVELPLEKESVKEIFSNLVGNALKFTARGGVEVRVSDLGPRVECSVSDTGVGISERDLPKVFSRFKQFGEAPRGEERGTGLGLYIAKQLVERHGGDISVSSRAGQGTTFRFTLPK